MKSLHYQKYVFCFFLLVWWWSVAQGQNVFDDRQSWRSPLLTQLDYLVDRLGKEISSLPTQYRSLGIVNLEFEDSFRTEFRDVAKFQIYDQFLKNSPSISLEDCLECRQVRSQINNGQLTISRGIQNSEARQSIAKRLGVQGFFLAKFTMKEEQLILVFQVIDVNTGSAIISKSIAGLLQPARPITYALGLGFLNMPFTTDVSNIKAIDGYSVIFAQHIALPSGLGFTTKGFTFFGANKSDLNTGGKNNYSLSTFGLALSGSVSYQWSFNIEQNFTARANVGIGRVVLLAPAFAGENFYEYGLSAIFNQNFTMSLQLIKLLKVIKFENSLPSTASGELGKKSMLQVVMGWQF